MVSMVGKYLRKWDLTTLARVDKFVAISGTIRDRIKDVYKRDSTVIYPPVEIDKFRFDPSRNKGDYYVCVSALVPYKRIDIMIDAFNRMPGKKLVIVGDGNARKEWEAKKTSSNIKFTGFVHHDEVVRICAGAKAFLYAAFEDFGIAPVEAQALGLPVIAYGKGGTSETVVPINGPAAGGNPTGVLFHHQDTQSFIDAIEEFERREGEFDPLDCRKNAEKFSEDRFVSSIKKVVSENTKGCK